MHLFLLIGLVAFTILAVLARDLLKAAIALAGASIFLAIIFFRMGGYYVSVFEITIVAGLITVLFIATVNMTRHQEQDVVESKWPRIIFPLFFLLFLVVDFLVMKKLLGTIPALQSAETGTFGEILWGKRSFDLIGQIGVIFAGVLSVLALFRKRSKHD